MIIRTLCHRLPLLTLALAGASAPIAPVAPASPRGVYVEARTASVFCGACHYNGERVTDGRAAVMAWTIDAGTFDGVDLAGTRVMAAVRCDDNLAEASAARTSEFVVDADSAARQKAAVAWTVTQCGPQLGTVTGVRAGKIDFSHDGGAFTVASPRFAALDVRPMPNGECCSQPHLVWYTPLMPVDHRRVGYTVSAGYAAGRVGDAWGRSDENSAFYGTFGGTAGR